MIELLLGTVISLTSLLIGYSLGKNQTVVSKDVQKQIKQIFRRVVPDSEIGVVERPTAQQNYYRDNPRVASEQEVMTQEFDHLNQNERA